MPPDIRSFFGGKGSQAGAATPQNSSVKDKDESGAGKKKKYKVRKVIDDSDDDDYEATKKVTPKKPTPRRSEKKPSPKTEVTTALDYFASSGKAKPIRSTPTKPKPTTSNKENLVLAKPESVRKTPQRAVAAKSSIVKKDPMPVKSAVGRTSGRKKPTTSYIEYNDNEDDAFLDDDEDAGDDIFSAAFKKDSRSKVEESDDDDDDDDIVLPHRKSVQRAKRAPSPVDEDVDMKDVDLDDDFEELPAKAPSGRRKAPPSKSSKKRKSPESEEEDSEEEYSSPKLKKKGGKTQTTPGKPPAKKARAKKGEPAENAEIQDIFDSIPMVRPPSPPPASDAPAKFNYRAQAQRGGPPEAGSKELPVGAENCLAGLTFVFTGVLKSLGREEGQELVKRYGGKVTGAPSAKTSFVVLGDEAGPKKLLTIKKNNIKTIDENGLFEMIRRLPANGGDGKAAKANEEKKKKEEEKVRQMAAEMEMDERRLKSSLDGQAVPGKLNGTSGKRTVDSRLWTVKYAPSAMNQICGNKSQVERLQRWLRNWPNALKSNFKRPGADMTGAFRAVIIHGPPGIGKTTAAHLVARMEGYDIIESNASDTRSKKLVESNLKGILDNTSLLGFFAGDHKKVEAGKKKIVLIMDEVDGMSAGDRGGVGALAQVCKKTQIPMILICNDRKLPKMRPFDHVTLDMPFRRPTANDIRSRVMTICFREGLKLSPQVIDALVEGTHADIRQIINMISTAKLDQADMDFDQGKSMSKAWEKHVILKPWDIAGKLLAGQMFASHSKATLNDKIELYFNDHEFSYLMIQENYLKPFPALANEAPAGKMRALKALQLAEEAAASISDADLVDAMIHGPQQQWSLMPTHAVFSTVKPASLMSGSMAGQGQLSFTSWLGNNSKQGKLTRYVKEIQGHMRLRASGDRHEIRQQYLPVLWTQTVQKMEVQGKDAVDGVIDLMDSYFLTKDDYDAIVELGLGPMDMANVKIDAQTKAGFTRLYNQKSHPMPFMKASNIVAPKALKKERPDLEEAIEESDEGEDAALLNEAIKEEDDEEDMDVTKDKYVKQAKKKAAPKKGAAAAKKTAPVKKNVKGKARVDDDEEEDDFIVDDDEEEEVKPKAKRGSKARPRKGK